MNKYLTSMYLVHTSRCCKVMIKRLGMDSYGAQILVETKDNTGKQIKQTPGMICSVGSVIKSK